MNVQVIDVHLYFVNLLPFDQVNKRARQSSLRLQVESVPEIAQPFMARSRCLDPTDKYKSVGYFRDACPNSGARDLLLTKRLRRDASHRVEERLASWARFPSPINC